LESQTSLELESLKDQIKTLEDQEAESKSGKDYLEQDLKSLRQQLDYAQDELYKQKSNLNNRLQERESEIEKLRNQVAKINVFKKKKETFKIFSKIWP
jgi:chromosome segregation ATPase